MVMSLIAVCLVGLICFYVLVRFAFVLVSFSTWVLVCYVDYAFWVLRFGDRQCLA